MSTFGMLTRQTTDCTDMWVVSMTCPHMCQQCTYQHAATEPITYTYTVIYVFEQSVHLGSYSYSTLCDTCRWQCKQKHWLNLILIQDHNLGHWNKISKYNLLLWLSSWTKIKWTETIDGRTTKGLCKYKKNSVIQKMWIRLTPPINPLYKKRKILLIICIW